MLTGYISFYGQRREAHRRSEAETACRRVLAHRSPNYL
jgi:hypothetical protein